MSSDPTPGRLQNSGRQSTARMGRLAMPACAYAPLLIACAALLASTSVTATERTPLLSVDAVPRIAMAGPGAPSSVAFLPGEPPRLMAALGEHGLAWFSLDGEPLGRFEEVDSALVTGLADGNGATVLAVNNSLTDSIHLLRFDAAGETLVELDTQRIAVDDELTGLCAGQSTLSGDWQLFAVTDAGMVHQWSVDPSGTVAPRQIRSLPAGKGAGHCVVHEPGRTLYLSMEEQGVLATGSEPESEPAWRLLALAAPRGSLSDEIKGLALLPAGPGKVLAVSDVGAGRVTLLAPETGAVLARVELEGLGEGEGLAAGQAGRYLAIADEDDGVEGRALRLLDWFAVAPRLGLAPDAEATDKQRQNRAAVVRPNAETEPVDSYGDAADDPAIWVNRDDPKRSLVLGTQKQRGVYLYDLDGKALQYLRAGRINNVDLRDGFLLDGRARTLVAGSDRTRKGIALFLLDGPGQTLTELEGSFIATDLADPYGLCLYRSSKDESFQVFVNDSPDGRTLQFRLTDNGAGGIAHELLRDIPVGAQAEGCVADDETGTLFVAEEEHGIWIYGAEAEAEAGSERRLLDSFENGRVEPDVEGLAIWKTPAQGQSQEDTPPGGYLVVSNQGRDSYLVYDRTAPHAYRGEFYIVAGDDIDGASETDGLEVTSAPLGDAYPQGLLVVQDGRNLGPRDRQNFKYIDWRDVAEALSLD